MKVLAVFFLTAFCGFAFAVEPDPALRLWLPLDEGVGAVTADQSPSRIEGELNGARWAKGAFGTAAHFGGAEASIELPPVPGLDGAKQFTLSLWATWEGTGRYPNLVTTRNWSPGGLMLFVRDDTLSFRMGMPGQIAGASGSTWSETSVPLLSTLPRGKWTHICVVFALPEITTYVNGKLVGKGKWTHPVAADGLRIGAWAGEVSHHGLIDDVRLHARAFSAAEVAALANDPSRADAAYTLVDESKIAPSLAATFENRRAALQIDTRGRVVSLRSKASGRELLARAQEMVAARLADGRQVTARKSSFADGALMFTFPHGEGAAVLGVETRDDFFTFTLRSLTLPGVKELTFVNLPVAPAKYRGGMANMLSDDEDAVCLRGYDLPVEMSIAGKPVALRVGTTAEHGLTGWRAGLAAGPKGEMPAMLRAMAGAAGVPVSKLGGPWSLGATANRGSYLFADLSLASVDDWIALAQRGGFTHLHLHGWWSTLGHYEVNRGYFPRGLDDMKAAVDRIHAAGLKAGIHTLTGCIDTRDSWVTPEASPQLIATETYTLAKPLSPADTVVWVNEKPASNHDIVFTYSGRGNVLRIGAELVQYSEVSATPPFAFKGVTRGAFKTRPAAHAAGAKVGYLQQHYLAFYPEPDSPLAGELADCIANVFNTCGLDQIYFDGSEGMGSRYGIDFMRHAIFKRLRGEVLVEASCHGEHNWWFHSRLGAWDHPVWAAKRFHDKHIAIAAEYRHTDLIEPQLGWWAPREPGPQARGHFLDEMEYFAAKNLGLGAAMSVQGVDVTHKPARYHIERQFTVLGWHERLRLARYFDDTTTKRVAVPGDEFRLRQERDGAWRFTPVKMAAHRISALGNGSEQWTGRNPFAAQPLAARIEALHAVAPYDSAQRKIVSDFADLTAFQQATASRDVTLHLAAETADTRGGAGNLRLHAENKGAAKDGAWARAALTFPAPYRDLTGTGAFGVWVKGDGSGALLNIQLATPREYMHALSDHYVTLDFTGWRYVELLLRERDVERMTDHQWPYGGTYDIYRNPIDLAHVSGLNLYLNDVPAGGTAEVVLGPVIALPVQPAELKNPALTVNGASLALPVTLKSGQFIELEPGGECVHYDERGDLLARVRPAGTIPALRAGDNALAFTCEKPPGVSARAEVTVNAFGKPFGTPRPRAQIDWKKLAREYDMPRWIIAPDGEDNAWDLPVRPGETAKLEIELSGAMENPALNINGRVIPFPVSLKTGQRLSCRDQRHWIVRNAARAVVAEGELPELLPALAPGPNRISFACAAPDHAIVRLAKVYEPQTVHDDSPPK